MLCFWFFSDTISFYDRTLLIPSAQSNDLELATLHVSTNLVFQTLCFIQLDTRSLSIEEIENACVCFVEL